jgi:hypothetical protein
MPPLKWSPGPAAPIPRTSALAMASRFELRRHRDVPAFLVAALRLRRTFRDADGGIGLGLRAQPLRRTFWTLSAWDDQGHLDGFTRHPQHRQVMQRFAPLTADAGFVTWAIPDDTVPTWPDALRRLAEAGAPTRH